MWPGVLPLHRRAPRSITWTVRRLARWHEAQIRRTLNPHRMAWWLQQVPGTQTLEDLAAALHHRTHDQGQDVDSKAADALQELRDPRTVALLRDAVHAPQVIARRQAVRVLAAFPLPQTLDLLLPALDDPDDTVRWNAATTLGALGDRRAVGPLVQAMGDRVYWVRHAVCWSLGQLGDERAMAPLIAALRDDPASGIRAVAGRALGELGDARAIEPLRQALDDPDAEVRNVAAYCLKNLERPPASAR